MIPHITNEIKRRITRVGKESGAESVLIVEVGGTVGDVEGQPFLEALRQLRMDVGRKNAMFVHITLFAVYRRDRRTENQADPAQRPGTAQPRHSTDVIGARGSDYPVSKDLLDKIAQFCDVDKEAVIRGWTTAQCLYEIPLQCSKKWPGRNSWVPAASS